MTRKSTWASFAGLVVLSLPLAACKDTKTLQENEQLKTQVAELQKESGEADRNNQQRGIEKRSGFQVIEPRLKILGNVGRIVSEVFIESGHFRTVCGIQPEPQPIAALSLGSPRRQ